MTYPLSQLVIGIIEKDPSGSAPSRSAQSTEGACIDLEKSSLTLLPGTPAAGRYRKRSKAPGATAGTLLKGVPIAVELEIRLKRQMAEGSSLVLFSPYLIADAPRKPPGTGLNRIRRFARKMAGWGSQKSGRLPAGGTIIAADAVLEQFDTIEMKSSSGSAAPAPKASPPVPEERRPAAASSMFRYWPVGVSGNEPIRVSVLLNSAMLNPLDPLEPVLRFSVRENETRVCRLGVRLPEECRRNLVFLFCKPSYVAFAIRRHGEVSEMHETISVFSSDGRPVKMTANPQQRPPPYVEAQFIAANMCRIQLAAGKAREALIADGEDRSRLYLRLSDQLSNQMLACHLPVNVALSGSADNG
jgi:hypothetical protein